MKFERSSAIDAMCKPNVVMGFCVLGTVLVLAVAEENFGLTALAFAAVIAFFTRKRFNSKVPRRVWSDISKTEASGALTLLALVSVVDFGGDSLHERHMWTVAIQFPIVAILTFPLAKDVTESFFGKRRSKLHERKRNLTSKVDDCFTAKIRAYEGDDDIACTEVKAAIQAPENFRVLAQRLHQGADVDYVDPYFQDNAAAQQALRVMKYFFSDLHPQLSSCSIEDVMKLVDGHPPWHEISRFLDLFYPEVHCGLRVFMDVVETLAEYPEMRRTSLLSRNAGDPVLKQMAERCRALLDVQDCQQCGRFWLGPNECDVCCLQKADQERLLQTIPSESGARTMNFKCETCTYLSRRGHCTRTAAECCFAHTSQELMYHRARREVAIKNMSYKCEMCKYTDNCYRMRKVCGCPYAHNETEVNHHRQARAIAFKRAGMKQNLSPQTASG